MKHRRQIAAALACALILGLCGGAALATDPVQDTAAQPPLLIAPDSSSAVSDTADTAAENEQPAGDADTAEADPAESIEAEEEISAPAPDPEGTLSFANLEQRVRENSLYYLMAEEQIANLEAYDFEKMQEDLREALNNIASAQWAMLSGVSSSGNAGNGGNSTESPAPTPGGSENTPGDIQAALGQMQAAIQGIGAMAAASTAQALDAQYDVLREQFDALKDGETQKEIADGIRAAKNEQDKLVMQAQSAYILLLEAQAGDATLATNLAALDRTIAEMELRYQYGQISAMQLQSLKASRSSLASQQSSVQTSLKNGLMQMESMIGEEITGTLKLSPLPQVTAEELNTMDLEKDLAAAKEASYDLYAAKKTLDDADEVYKDSGAKNHYNEKNYKHVQARHVWQAAQYTYDATIQMFELSFRTLYNQIKDYQQLLAASTTTLAVQEDNYRAAQLKYEQGAISEYALLEAEDTLSAAQDSVTAAAIDLFTAYNNYRWAVDHGILN